jgi:hypothetical protein
LVFQVLGFGYRRIVEEVGVDENERLREMLALDEKRITTAVEREREEIVGELESCIGSSPTPPTMNALSFAVHLIKARGEKKPGKIKRFLVIQNTGSPFVYLETKINELIDAVNEMRAR